MFRAILISCVVLGFIVPVAQAEKKVFESVKCGSGVVSLLSGQKGAIVLALEQNKIDIETGQSQQCNGVLSIIGGKRVGTGFCKELDTDGDFFLVQWTAGKKSGSGTWKYIFGTGKWKGVTGGGTYERILDGKPIAKGTYYNCSRGKGTYELPKK